MIKRLTVVNVCLKLNQILFLNSLVINASMVDWIFIQLDYQVCYFHYTLLNFSLFYIARVVFNETYTKIDFELKIRNISSNSVRIVFLFTITGRSLRHVHRIFKMLYHKHHYFYFHIDSVSL
jgi:hypothetical protein